jgi:hypothetical protein
VPTWKLARGRPVAARRVRAFQRREDVRSSLTRSARTARCWRPVGADERLYTNGSPPSSGGGPASDRVHFVVKESSREAAADRRQEAAAPSGRPARARPARRVIAFTGFSESLGNGASFVRDPVSYHLIDTGIGLEERVRRRAATRHADETGARDAPFRPDDAPPNGEHDACGLSRRCGYKQPTRCIRPHFTKGSTCSRASRRPPASSSSSPLV